MKLARYGALGEEKPALVDNAGRLRDARSVCPDFTAETLAADSLERLRQIDPESLPLVPGKPRIGVPYTGLSKFICIGLNYSDHAAESGMAVPSEPIIFLKAPSAVCGPNDDTIQPRNSTQLDWEVELGVVIGRKASYVEEDAALDHVAGYCVVNDVSERAFQRQSGQWDKGKGCDSFGPIGPWLVTPDEVMDPQDLDMWLDVNGVRRQSGNSRTMIFSVREIVAYCSRFMTLLPGDVIATGTPPGVAMGMKPEPIWLQPGDVVELGIAGLGSQRQRIVSRDA
ncbi:fumarylacetoacetate hydrolase family protein [Flavisphingomonas formosensis]|uniref:fumarylacetoacetate hydrolase family protein n=1 Tax=Flavisphingomonas formosensis TaxID=861534 RepID=UPI0012F9A669|nr:fumarylacetoacetate hydrolase family protein [Sphingomonas formosensis]